MLIKTVPHPMADNGTACTLNIRTKIVPVIHTSHLDNVILALCEHQPEHRRSFDWTELTQLCKAKY